MRVSTLYNSRSGRIYSEAEMPSILFSYLMQETAVTEN